MRVGLSGSACVQAACKGFGRELSYSVVQVRKLGAGGTHCVCTPGVCMQGGQRQVNRPVGVRGIVAVGARGIVATAVPCQVQHALAAILLLLCPPSVGAFSSFPGRWQWPSPTMTATGCCPSPSVCG